jgi:hypothetical protein
VNPAVIHFDKSIFGEDPGVFRPERWVEAGANVANMDRHIMQFGMGARVCLGKNVSAVCLYVFFLFLSFSILFCVFCFVAFFFAVIKSVLTDGVQLHVRDLQSYSAATSFIYL